MNRRDFLQRTGLLVTGGIALSCTPGTRTGTERRLNRTGVQLYTVRDQMEVDVERTLSRVADIGYDEVEFAGLFGHAPREVRTMMDRFGLRAPSSHISLGAFRQNAQDVIDTAQTLGQQYVVVPSLPGGERTSIDDYRRLAEEFNTLGSVCRQAGLRFGYHNHAFEYEVMDGQVPYDVLLDETDADLVDMELDLYWVIRGGHDPVDYFERYPGRFPLCHVKDMDEEGQPTVVGQGSIDFAGIFQHAEHAGLQHYFVEHDHPQDSFASITQSQEYLSQLRF